MPRARWAERVPAHWRLPLLRLAGAWAALIALFWADWRDMAGQAWDSSTYNHILLIPPIIAWLVSQRLGAVSRLTPAGWWPGLVVFAGAAFLWMLGDFAGLSIARQLAVMVMLQGAFLALIGPRVATAMLFPLFYMLFLVPAGDELIPFLQTLTAKITMVLLGLSQVPATIDGVFITTPGGYFEVAEACSGVKFLIAMIAYGALVSNVCFRAWPRRAAFMALCVATPILANGVRAWGTIWIAGFRGIEFASSFDHIFYGWIFFAIVMGLVMLAGWKFFDRAIDDPMVDLEKVQNSQAVDRLETLRLGQNAALGVLAGLAALFVGWGAMANAMRAPVPAAIAAPNVPGWHMATDAARTQWVPLHTGADHRLILRYTDSGGSSVDVSYALYDAQMEGKEAGGFGQGALPMGSHWAWESSGPAFADGKSDVVQAPGPVHRLAVTRYRTGQLLTGSNAKLKLANIADRLLLRSRPTAVLILSAEEGQAVPAPDLIRHFEAAIGPVPEWMDRMAAVR